MVLFNKLRCYTFLFFTALGSMSLEASAQETERALITVFIHGTLFPIISWESIKHACKVERKPNRSLYQHYLESVRYHSFLQYQPMGGEGLVFFEDNHASGHTLLTYATGSLFKAAYAKKKYYKEYRYSTFSWGGSLRQQSRKNAARALYFELLKAKNELESQTGLSVDIDLYGHSHGGNVILNLAGIEADEKKRLHIKHAILLGTPIQKETVKYSSADMFEAVYNFYSRGDAVQIADVFSTKTFGSYRRFDQCAKNEIFPPKVKHVECSVGKLKPRHAELWLYKKSGNFLYRSYLDICPLPFFVYIPHILDKLDDCPQNNLFFNISKARDAFSCSVTTYSEKSRSEQKFVFVENISADMFTHHYFS